MKNKRKNFSPLKKPICSTASFQTRPAILHVFGIGISRLRISGATRAGNALDTMDSWRQRLQHAVPTSHYQPGYFQQTH
jgi:hypothetical protein